MTKMPICGGGFFNSQAMKQFLLKKKEMLQTVRITSAEGNYN